MPDKPRSMYDSRRARREADRQRALGGETLDQFHARENAAPPTLTEIYRRNRADTAVCPRTPDLFLRRSDPLPAKTIKILKKRFVKPEKSQ